MGAGQGTALRLIDDEIELLRETRDFARWTLSDVAQLTTRFQKTHGMAITESQLDNLLLFKASDIVGTKEIFVVLDTNRDGRIDGLEFIAALTCVCRASFEDKARFAFELFDFNLNGSLSLTEFALLMKSVWVGMSLLTGHAMSKTLGASPSTSVTRFLQLAQHAFNRFDRDGGASLQYEEFIEWARSNREFMLQVEQFRVISEKAVGLEDTISLPDGSDNDSDLEEETKLFVTPEVIVQKTSDMNEELRHPELSAPPWIIEPTIDDQSIRGNSKLDFPPPVNVELEWLYGYASSTVRNAIRVLVNGDVVYVVSKYAIVYTPERHQQRYYFGHKYPITCIDVNATGTIIATGDAVPMQHRHSEIHVWNGLTLECLSVLCSFHTDSIASLAFPPPVGIQVATPLTTGGASGKNANLAGAVASAKKQHHAADALLVSIGTDVNASMALWDWQNAQLLASGRAINKRKRVLCVAVCEDGHEVLVGGEHFLVFHHVDARFFKMKKPKALDAKIQTMPVCLSATYHGPHTAVVGTARGELLQFNHMQLTRVIQAHDIGQSVNVCTLSCRSMVLFTAGKDGMIKQWDSTLQPIGNPIDLHRSAHAKGLDEEDFRVHSMSYDATSQRYFVGTRHGHLLILHEANLRTEIIASSHRGADIDHLATSRFGVCFATCSISDRTVRRWNMRRRKNDMTVKLAFPPTACVFSTANGGELLAVGGKDGSIALFRAKTMVLLSRIKNTQTAIQCMRFHPSESRIVLAVSCANGLIYLYTIDDSDGAYHFHRFALLKPLTGEPSPLVYSLDFSVDGRFLKSQHGRRAGPHQDDISILRFWQIRTNRQSVSRITTMSTIRNVQWQTYTSEVGWHVNALNSCQIVSSSTNSTSSVLATIDHSGELSFRHFPCATQQGDNRRPLAVTIKNAHLQGIGSVSFALHDSILLSTSRGYGEGGAGSVVCQWAVRGETRDSQSRATNPLNSDSMWSLLVSLRLESLYFFDDSYVPRSNHSAIGAVLPASSLLDSSTEGSSFDARCKSEAPDLDLSLVYAHGLNHAQSGVNQIFVGMNGSTGSHNSIVYGAGTLLVSLLVSPTQVKQQRVLQSGLRHDISSVVKQSNSIIAVGSQRENRVNVWQWEPTPHLLGVLRGPQSHLHVLSAFDSCDFISPHGRQGRGLAAVVWYSPSSALHVICFYHWRKTQDQDRGEGGDDNVIQADMTRLPVLFGFFTPPFSLPSLELTNAVGFVSGGVDHVTFWWFTVCTSHIVCQSGVFGRHALVETAICGAYASPYVLTGMMSGAIVIWDNGIAAFSLPAIESKEKLDDKQAVVCMVTIAVKQQVLVALRNGNIVLFFHAKEQDESKYQAHGFLKRLRAINLFDDPCVWRMIRAGGSPITNESSVSAQVKQAHADASVVQSLTLLEDLQNGFAVILSCGMVLTVEGQAILSSGASFDAKVVLDSGQLVTATDTHPVEQWVALGNSDGRISVYHLESHTLVQENRLMSGSVKALAWQQCSLNPRLVASLANGEMMILAGPDLVAETTFPCGPSGDSSGLGVKRWCWKMKFSPQGSSTTWLAAACRNYHIYVYTCSISDPNSTMKCELAHDFAGHTAPIVALDFSVDGCWLQSATSALDSQLMRWELSSPGEENNRLPIGEPATWHSWTVQFAGPVDGLKEVFGAAVTAIDRIRGEASDDQRLWTSRLPTVLIGTETGRVFLGWFPLRCGEGKLAMFKEYDGYSPVSSSVDQVCFSANNEFAVTTTSNYNRNEGVVLVWKTDYEDEIRQLQRADASSTDDKATSMIHSTALADEEASATKTFLEKDDQRFVDEARGGDEFMAVKPWLGAIREPTVLPPGIQSCASSPPPGDLALEFIYGVNPNATNTRNDVFYADDSWEIVYSAASFGVVYNTKTRTQLLNTTHDGQMISCVTVHPVRGDLVVTADIAGGRKRPRLVAWDANSGSTINQIETVHTRGVALLTFAPSGERVASVGMDDDHVIAIYSLNHSQGLAKFKLLAQMKTSKQPVYALAFHSETDSEFVTAGQKHILFWAMSLSSSATRAGVTGHHRQRGSAPNGIGSKGAPSSWADAPITLSMKKGLFGTIAGKDGGSGSKILAAVYVPRSQQPSQVVTGQHDGSLFVWRARQCVDGKQLAHKGAIYALAVDQKRPQVFYSGGQDGKVKMWNPQLELLVTLDVEKLFAATSDAPLCNFTIKSIALRESRILLSTDGGDIAELVPEDPHAIQILTPASTFKPQIHLRSHFKGELWGLATHPTKLLFATAGDDGTVRVWDATMRSLLSIYLPKSGSSKWRTISFSSDGSHLAVGSSDGYILILNESLDQTVKTWRCCPKGISVVKYAPESLLLAIGTHDQGIYVYDGHTYKPKGVCRGHSGTVTHLDFSSDGRFLQSTSSAGELLFWDLSGEPKQIPSATAVRDTSWFTWTLPFGWPVQGIWAPGSDGSDVNAVSRSNDRKVVATGDDFGLVKLFQHPCLTPKAPYKPFAGHASHVTNCSFTRDDYYLLTTGGIDNTICQYKYYVG